MSVLSNKSCAKYTLMNFYKKILICIVKKTVGIKNLPLSTEKDQYFITFVANSIKWISTLMVNAMKLILIELWC